MQSIFVIKQACLCCLHSMHPYSPHHKTSLIKKLAPYPDHVDTFDCIQLLCFQCKISLSNTTKSELERVCHVRRISLAQICFGAITVHKQWYTISHEIMEFFRTCANSVDTRPLFPPPMCPIKGHRSYEKYCVLSYVGFEILYHQNTMYVHMSFDLKKNFLLIYVKAKLTYLFYISSTDLVILLLTMQ